MNKAWPKFSRPVSPEKKFQLAAQIASMAQTMNTPVKYWLCSSGGSAARRPTSAPAPSQLRVRITRSGIDHAPHEPGGPEDQGEQDRDQRHGAGPLRVEVEGDDGLAVADHQRGEN